MNTSANLNENAPIPQDKLWIEFVVALNDYFNIQPRLDPREAYLIFHQNQNWELKKN